MDVCPRLEHTLSLAALLQAITRMLCRLKARNLKWREYDRFLIGENRWRAQRYGTTEGLIDFGERRIRPMEDLVNELIGMVSEDAEALGSMREIMRVKDIIDRGTSAVRQRRIWAEAEAMGKDPGHAVVAHLIEEFNADL